MMSFPVEENVFTYFFIFKIKIFGKLGPVPGGGPRLDRQARIQFKQVYFGVFSTSRFVPPSLSLDWT